MAAVRHHDTKPRIEAYQQSVCPLQEAEAAARKRRELEDSRLAQALADTESVRRQAALDRDESIARSIAVRL